MNKFSAFVVRSENDQFTAGVEKVSLESLSSGDVLIKINYSSVNYKDALAAKENGGVIRNYPMIPGIDLSGTVVETKSKDFSVGDAILVTGYGLGVSHTGGYAEYAQVPDSWLVPLPKDLTLKEAMILGTAGLTAALCINALEKHGLSKDKNAKILVTGASGGVGTLAIQMLSHLGYSNITALTRKENSVDYLKKIGASFVLLMDEFIPEKIKPLDKQQFDFAVDTTGGNISSALLPKISYNGSVAICGNAAGIQLSTTVLPFILRNVSLLGIDSVNITSQERTDIWKRMSADLNILKKTDYNEISLEELPEIFTRLQQGIHVGRTIVKIS